ncbi:hypothetical protein LIER_30300 [Lithospermum erythrorhizon]|uniref:Uncharacterized protein n=1 Tax=Lithospermum erythrorhizon TaxID=34254 RepID=A0AAV3RQ97_LITER
MMKWNLIPISLEIVGELLTVIGNTTLKKQFFRRENGILILESKKERMARKRPHQETGTSNNVLDIAHVSVPSIGMGSSTGQDSLLSVEDELRAIRRNQEAMMSCYIGIVKFLTCWGKRNGSTDDDLHHLHIPITIQEESSSEHTETDRT